MPYKDPEKRRQAQREYMKAYQARHPGVQVQRNTRQKKALRQRLTDYKQARGCAQCGENHPACLDFHHTDPSKKEGNLYAMPSNRGWKWIELEVAKCIVLCANCHRKLHYAERLEEGDRASE